MSTMYKQSRPLPVDPEAEAKEAERQQAIVGNSTLQRNMLAAQRQEIENRKNELHGAIADLRRMKLAAARSNFHAALNGYMRSYERIQRLAQTIANVTGQTVEIPKYDPPSESGGAGMAQVKPARLGSQIVTRPDGSTATVIPSESYRETGGKGKSGKGLPTAAPVPGSAQANEDGLWPM